MPSIGQKVDAVGSALTRQSVSWGDPPIIASPDQLMAAAIDAIS